MLRWRPVLLAALFSGLLAQAFADQADEKKPLVINSFPPGAQVFEANEYKGKTGEPIFFSGGTTHSLTVKLDHHKPESFTISAKEFEDGRYPEEGEAELKPLSLQQAFLDLFKYRTWFRVLLAGLGVAGVLGFLKFRAWKANQAELLTLAKAGASLTGSGQRSLILQQIGNYRVLSMLGEGGMAEVYSAVPIETMDIKAAVAIKVINKESREKGASMDRFQREIEVSQGLNHPGIVEVKEWGWHGDRLYLAMELVEGQELRELLPDIKRDWAKISDILSQLMVAVNFAHQRGVYHRDLKPENVMITSDGKVKVMDFGLAKTIDSKTLTKTGTCMGTPKYIAPEAISGKDVDDRADQYTLGVMAYEMIVGQVPFDGDEVFHLLYSHAALPPPPPSMVVEGMPQAIDDVLLRMLSKIPEERYRDLEEARVELLKALQAVS